MSTLVDKANDHVSSDPPTSSSQKRGIIFRLSTAVDEFMRNVFFRLGLFVASNPIKVIIVSVIFMAITLAGLIRFRSESRDDELWIPQSTTATINQRFVDEKYGRLFRSNEIAFRPGESSKSLGTQDAFLEMLDIAEKGFYIVVDPVNPGGDEYNTRITFADRCINTTDRAGNSFCRTESPFNLFYDAELAVIEDGRVNFFATVRKKINTVSDEEITNTLMDPPAVSFDGAPFNSDELYAASEDDPSVYIAMRYTQLLENNAIEKDGESIDVEADKIEEAWTKLLLDELDGSGEYVSWYVDSSWGQGESLSKALSGDLPLLSVGFVLLAIYVVVFLGDFHSVRSHRLLGIAALVTTGLAMGTCFGLSSAVGMFFGPVHQILPLLILGIGIDDCFHITRSADEICLRPQDVHKPIETRIALALSQSGTAITVTSFTNVAVFLLSGISRLPALRYFALWAAIGIFFAWVYAITFYTAFVTLDFRRIDAQRLDCVPCVRRKTVNELNWFKKPPGSFSRFFSNQFGPLIMRNPVRIVLLALFAAGLGASIYGCTQLYLKFRFAFFYPSGTSQRAYQDFIDDNFKIGDPTFIYVRDNDMSTVKNQEEFLKLCNSDGIIANNEYIQKNTVDCWFEEMLKVTEPANGELYTPAEYIEAVKAFVAEGSPNNRYADDILFNEDNTEVISTRFSAKYVYRETNYDEIDGLESVRNAAALDAFGTAEGVPASFPYTFFDTFTEQYAALPGEIGLSLGFASLAVAVVCLVLVGHPVVAVVSVIVVGIIIVGVLGLTYYTDINLNSVSVITLVLCTGIAVDFVVHIARAFLEHVGSRKERAIKALGSMGPPVFYAGFSTFLAIIVLAGAESYIFRVLFLGFLFLIVLAFLHGLILGPILLSLVGPPSFYASEEEKNAAERSLEERFVSQSQTQPKTASSFEDEKGSQVNGLNV